MSATKKKMASMSDLSTEWATRDAEVVRATIAADEVQWVQIDRINPNPKQPRLVFESGKLVELAEDIRKNGILEPLLGRKSQDGSITLIVGERRLRAARMAGLPRVPIILKECTEEELEDWAISENLKRADLHPIEEALLLGRQVQRFGGQVEAAKHLGLNRVSLALKVRFARLDQQHLERLLALPNLTFRQLRPLAAFEKDAEKITQFIQNLENSEREEAEKSNEINDVATATRKAERIPVKSIRFHVRPGKGESGPLISVKFHPETTAEATAKALARVVRECSSRNKFDETEILSVLRRELKNIS
jgi:ParB/RepB/Spo0J family partition protein